MRTMLKFGTVIAIAISIAVVLACRPETLATPNPTANAAQPEAAPTPPTNTEPITIAAAGDIMMASSYPNETRIKTRSGKIMRRLLRDIAEGKTLGDTTTLADPAVVAKLKEQYADEQG